jgi:hypothetical protein
MIAQLIMSDLQTFMGDDILQMIGCLRDGKEAVGHLKSRYPEEANNVALDIKTKLGATVSWHCNIKPALSISILNRNRMSSCLPSLRARVSESGP